MSTIDDLVAQMRGNPTGIRFAEATRVCDHYFGAPTSSGTSHRVYRMPWPGDPRVNIQSDHGLAKAYQIRQILRAIDRLGQGE